MILNGRVLLIEELTRRPERQKRQKTAFRRSGRSMTGADPKKSNPTGGLPVLAKLLAPTQTLLHFRRLIVPGAFIPVQSFGFNRTSTPGTRTGYLSLFVALDTRSDRASGLLAVRSIVVAVS